MKCQAQELKTVDMTGELLLLSRTVCPSHSVFCPPFFLGHDSYTYDHGFGKNVNVTCEESTLAIRWGLLRRNCGWHICRADQASLDAGLMRMNSTV